MKKMKKLLSMLLAVVMVLAMAAPSFAANENSSNLSSETTNFSITVAPQSDKVSIEGKTFYAYKLFNVTYNLTNNAYSYTINSDLFGNFSYKGNSGEALVDYIAKAKQAEELNAVAEAALHYLEDKLQEGENISKFSAGSATVQEGENSATINLTEAGYYLVSGSAKATNGGQEITAACALTTTNPNASVNVKADAPTLEKKIVETETNTETNESTEHFVDANNASVGEDVTYEIKSNVPAMTGYEKYYFIVHDTLSKGLTYKANSIVITMKSKDGTPTALTKDNDYTVDASIDPTSKVTNIKIVFDNFIQYRESNPGAEIIIRYSATVNEDAVIGVEGNPNEAKLQYSNNPNVEDKGKPGKPNEPENPNVTGETPNDVVLTYIAGIDLLKVAENENGLSLKGAEFQITGEKVNKVAVQTWGFNKVESGTGDYYKLKDGTYTTQAPIAPEEDVTTGTEDKYESLTKDYKKAETPTVKWKEKNEALSIEGTVGEDGVLRFDGLGEGTYFIKEIKAPNGYNILKERIKVEITCVEPTITFGNEKATWNYTITYVDDNGNKVDNIDVINGTVTENGGTDNRIAITVVNNAGTLLPSTGGIGTTIFYAAGIILMAGAVFFVVRRKKA